MKGDVGFATILLQNPFVIKELRMSFISPMPIIDIDAMSPFEKSTVKLFQVTAWTKNPIIEGTKNGDNVKYNLGIFE